jgi:NADPH-dependent F420 reductase
LRFTIRQTEIANRKASASESIICQKPGAGQPGAIRRRGEDVNIEELTVGIIGGTGEEGRGLALRWAMAGAQVILGSRVAERAREAADELNQVLGQEKIRYGTNEAAVAASEFVLLTVPFNHAAATLESLNDNFRSDAILIDITVPVSFEQGRVRYVEPAEGSASEHLQGKLPQHIPLVAAFKTEPAHLLLDPQALLDCDTFVASDHKEAKARVIEAIKHLAGLRAVDAGVLYSARCLERMTILLIGINRRYKTRTGRFQVLGLSES